MVPTSFLGFFAASAGASAALIGLLFVAISISPERIIAQSASPERRVVAVSVFASLLNGFFISLAALIPDTNLAWVVIILAPLSAYSALRLTVGLFQRSWRQHEHVTLRTTVSRLFLALATLGIYTCEIVWAIATFTGAFTGSGAFTFIAYLLIGVYTSGLTRAWGLVVDRQPSAVSWFSALSMGSEASAGATAQPKTIGGEASPASPTAKAPQP